MCESRGMRHCLGESSVPGTTALRTARASGSEDSRAWRRTCQTKGRSDEKCTLEFGCFGSCGGRLDSAGPGRRVAGDQLRKILRYGEKCSISLSRVRSRLSADKTQRDRSVDRRWSARHDDALLREDGRRHPGAWSVRRRSPMPKARRWRNSRRWPAARNGRRSWPIPR